MTTYAQAPSPGSARESAAARTVASRLAPADNERSKTESRGLVDHRPVARQLTQLAALTNPRPVPPGPTAAGKVAQLATVIHNTTRSYNYGGGSMPVGATTDGYLDPADPKKGSAPGAAEIQPVMDAFKAAGYKSMIKGHLMNGQVGGPGLASNLFPITSRANSWHKGYAENHIKHAVTKGYFVHYQVNVNSAFNIAQPDATFECNAHYWDPKKNKNGKELLRLGVKSEPVAKGKGGAKLIDLDTNAEATKWKKTKLTFFDWMPNSIPFKTANLAKGWGEEGDGNARPGGRGQGRIAAQGHYHEDGTQLT